MPSSIFGCHNATWLCYSPCCHLPLPHSSYRTPNPYWGTVPIDSKKWFGISLLGCVTALKLSLFPAATNLAFRCTHQSQPSQKLLAEQTLPHFWHRPYDCSWLGRADGGYFSIKYAIRKIKPKVTMIITTTPIPVTMNSSLCAFFLSSLCLILECVISRWSQLTTKKIPLYTPKAIFAGPSTVAIGKRSIQKPHPSWTISPHNMDKGLLAIPSVDNFGWHTF